MFDVIGMVLVRYGLEWIGSGLGWFVFDVIGMVLVYIYKSVFYFSLEPKQGTSKPVRTSTLPHIP